MRNRDINVLRPSLKPITIVVFIFASLAISQTTQAQGIFLPTGRSGTGGELSLTYLSRTIYGLGGNYGFSYRGLLDVRASFERMHLGNRIVEGGAISVAYYPIRSLTYRQPVGVMMSGTIGLRNNHSIPDIRKGRPSDRKEGSLILLGYSIGGYIRSSFDGMGPDFFLTAAYHLSSVESPFPEFPDRFTGSSYSIAFSLGFEHANGSFTYMRPGISVSDGRQFFTFAIGNTNTFGGG